MEGVTDFSLTFFDRLPIHEKQTYSFDGRFLLAQKANLIVGKARLLVEKQDILCLCLILVTPSPAQEPAYDLKRFPCRQGARFGAEKLLAFKQKFVDVGISLALRLQPVLLTFASLPSSFLVSLTKAYEMRCVRALREDVA